MQVINNYFGGEIEKISGHMKATSKIFFTELFFNQKTIQVKCFHNFCIKSNLIPKELKIIATDKSNNVEMFKHYKKKIIGVMWHPEREKNYNRLNIIINQLLKKK
jgi:putative glutamine amidotransferase